MNEQLVILEIKKNGHNIVIFGVYATCEGTKPKIKDDFHNKLAEILSEVKENCEIYILGDLNGRVVRKEIISTKGTTKRIIENRTQGKKVVSILNSLLWSKYIR